MKTLRRKPEPTIALINVVFLMLIFFLVAGTLTQPLDPDLKLVETEALEQTPPQIALVAHEDERLTFKGEDVPDLAGFLEKDEVSQDAVRIIPDKDLPAQTLVSLGAELRSLGVEKILIVTERGLQ